MRKTVMGLLLTLPLTVNASVECEFIVSEVKIGEYGNNEGKAFVCDSAWSCYNLGEITSDATKLRYSTVMAALVSGKKIRLRFYGETECSAPKSNLVVPNSTWLRK